MTASGTVAAAMNSCDVNICDDELAVYRIRCSNLKKEA